MNIRTRIAPSPTGPLHIGTARTALFNFLYAKQNKGAFILRIEDTDIERSDARFEKDIIDGLLWLGIQWDEGPYRQSKRIDIYDKYLERILKEKRAFWCNHTEKNLSAERDAQAKTKEPPRHVCEFRDKGLTDGEVIRFKNNESRTINFNDLIRGDISFKPNLLGDFAIAKKGGAGNSGVSVLYNFAVVVDDYEMTISHVIRGEDHIPNTPKQILIQKSFGLPEPKYAHLPLILGKDRAKISKRHDAISIFEYRQEGYLKETLINFMALLGWHPDDDSEIFSIDELLENFSLKRVQKSGAVFDIDKLNWLNKEYINKMPPDHLRAAIMNFLPDGWKKRVKENDSFFEKVVQVEKSRITTLSDFKKEADYFFEEPIYSKELLQWKKDRQDFKSIITHLDMISDLMSRIESDKFNGKNLEEKIMPYANDKGRGEVLWPMRVALTGRRASAGPFEIAEILGKEIAIKRVNEALKMLKNEIYGIY